MPGVSYTWTETQPLGDTDHKWIMGASDNDGSVLLAGIYVGRLYLSTNSGTSWAETQPGGAANKEWYCATSDSDGSFLIVGEEWGSVYWSTNSGGSWSSAGLANKMWEDVACDADGSNIIICSWGVDPGEGRVWIYKSGAWSNVQPTGEFNVDYYWYCVTSDNDGSVLLAGCDSTLWLSTNSGTSWTEMQPEGVPSGASWQCAASNSDGSRLIVGENVGRLWISDDTGASWTETRPDGDASYSWWEVRSDSTGAYLFAGRGLGYLYVSSDYGVSWSPTTPKAGSTANGAFVLSGDGTKLLVSEYLVTGRVWIGYIESPPPIPPPPIELIVPSGFQHNEYYLYSNKAWEMAPSGVSIYTLASGVRQNAPIIVTSSGYETTSPSQPWGQTSGENKYTKVGHGYFILLEDGGYDPTAKEFSLRPDSPGKLEFNGPLNENVYIEYESGPSGYYILDSIDYNPLRAEVEGGFVHFSDVTEPTSLFLTASQSSIIADGYRRCKLTVTLFDNDFDRVPDKDIIFEVLNLLPATSGPGYYSEYGYLSPYKGTMYYIDASGQTDSVKETTNKRGEAVANYFANSYKNGIVEIKAYYLAASGIYDTVAFAQYYMSAQPFTLDISLLDSLDYLT